ncbi:hypothetical protein [Microbacterium invictum]|uniref:SAF domain-containing protein n=1 Tax=Microbacterium invictum TaxID=515415 RepID=A0ABZ0V7Z9_9MICO|nr:hypothetical protein [Microbacterium invictum]WQB68912.1 hypothetical protein T9R20_09290 [Microbacterium invictum]
MTVPPAAPAPDAPPPSRSAWIARTWDRIPTGWFAGILTAVFLAGTAAFGGLAQAAVPPLPELEPGETHVNEQFALTVERAVLIDELPEAGITVEPGQRVLAVVLTAENVWDRALPSESSGGLSAGMRVAELADAPPAAIARFDDTTFAPYLQPRVPAELVVTWAVDRNALAEGDEIEIVLRDLSLREGALVVAGEYWESPVTAATMTLEVTDVGAGSDAEGDEG